jgi:hypothetical protein
MSKPMENKSPEIINAIETVFPGTKEAINNCKCPMCKSTIDINRDFRDTLSQREYLISGLCQNCQDQIWGV